MLKSSLKQQREIIINFIKKNPNTTTKEIQEKTKLHYERVFKNGLAEAFNEAKIKHPRNLKIKTKKEKERMILNYIKENPGVGGHTIAKEIKINVTSVFPSIKDAYKKAGVEYLRTINNKSREQKRKEIINLVKENPLITISEIMKKTNTQPYRIFRNIKEIYDKAGIKKIKGTQKRTKKKQEEIINFIKKHPLATQREINKSCNTHVQQLFKKGIFEAYENAGVEYPFERLKLYGVGLKEIRERTKTFEEEIAIKLSGYGRINRLMKTKRGVADIIFERKGKKAIIEVKDYQKKDISLSQVRQLNKYLEDCACRLGFLICHKKPKKDKFIIKRNTIIILDKENLDEIPKILEGDIV